MNRIIRKTLLCETGVEYGDWTVNHVLSCSHDCKCPCCAMMLSKRFGKVTGYEDWRKPRIVENAIDLFRNEIPRKKIKSHRYNFVFSTDTFMYGYL
jgi:DNA repair photolyase